MVLAITTAYVWLNGIFSAIMSVCALNYAFRGEPFWAWCDAVLSISLFYLWICFRHMQRCEREYTKQQTAMGSCERS